MALGELDGQAMALFAQYQQEIHHAAQVTDDGCNGGTQCAHTKPGNQDGVENDVDHGTQNRTNHGFIGKTLTAHQIGMDEAQHDDGRAEGEHGVVALRIVKRFCACTQQGQKW